MVRLHHALLVVFLCVARGLGNIVGECQDLSTCPKSYENTMSDYTEGDSLEVEASLVQFMQEQMDEYIGMILHHFPPTKFDTANVFNGVGGRSLLFLRLHLRTGNSTYLDLSREYFATAMAKVDTLPGSYCGFLWGAPGLYALGAVLADVSQDAAERESMLDKVRGAFASAVSDSWAAYDDWDSGRAGLLYAGAFLGDYFRNRSVVPVSLQVAVAQSIVDRGARLSDEPEAYLEWLSPNDQGKWLGQSHGSAGVLHGLFYVPEILENATARRLIVGTVDHIVASQFASGNFPSEYYDDDEDELVQWDHGAPGVMGMLAEASVLLRNASYLESARRAADCTWDRGLLTKGLMLCHGISGNTYMQLYLAKRTGDPTYLWRALQFQRFVASYPPLHDPSQMRQPTPSPFYFFTASYESAVMLWSDLVAFAQDPGQATMPGYEAAGWRRGA